METMPILFQFWPFATTTMHETTTFERPYTRSCSVPEETSFYYSPIYCIFSALLSETVAAGIMYLLYKYNFTSSYEPPAYWIANGFIFLIVSLFGLLTIDLLKHAFNKKLQISLSNHGIYAISHDFQSWEHIKDETIKIEGYKYRISYLYYLSAGTPIKINIGLLNTTSEELDKLLHVYRVRYEQQKTRPIDLHTI